MLYQLRVFCEIVDQNFSISRAAESLRLSQPRVSKYIQQLETELGRNLLHRRRGKVYGLTGAGQAALRLARRMMRDSEALRAIQEDDAQPSGRISLVATHTTALFVLTAVISRFRRKHPNIGIDLIQAVPGRTYEFVRSGQADIGITSDQPPGGSAGLVIFQGYQMRRVLLTPKGHPLMGAETISVEDISDYPLVTHNLSAAGASSIARNFESRRLTPTFAVTAFDSGIIKECVCEGLGVAVLPSVCADGRDDRVRARDVTHLFGPISMFIVLQRHAELRTDIAEFVHEVAEDWTFEDVEKSFFR